MAVFPCVPGGKEPLTPRGFHDASCEAAAINEWWGLHPDANIAFCPHTTGLGIVDLDGTAGEDRWLELQIERGFVPETYTVATPRGGRHLYFFGVLPPSQSKIGAHIDTRGLGSYALLPPSRLEGWPEPYRVIDGRTPQALPTWVSEAASHQREKAKASDDRIDQPSAIARARALLLAYVERGNVAVEGQMGDAKTYSVACELLNLGLSEDTTVTLMDELWNPHCLPPWDYEEIVIKVSNAASYAQNEPGAWATAPASEVFGSVLDKLGLSTTQERRSRFYPYDENEQDNLADPTWLFPDLLPDESIVMMFGESGTYKSFLALDMGLTAASGIAGFGAAAAEPQDVVYVAGEGPRSIARKRRPAWRVARDVTAAIPFHIVSDMPLLARPDMIGELIEAIQARELKPRLIILDTLARAMAGLNENDAKDAGLFVEAVESLKRVFGCTILVVHHSGKEASRGARGSSALQAGFDVTIEVKAHKPTKAVALHMRKQKDADERETPWCFEGRTVGPSLVFFPITTEQFGQLTASGSELSSKKVGAALAQLGARGEENGVTTHVLAAALITPGEGETPEQRQEAVDRAARALKARAKDALEAYCTGVGPSLRWGLPA